MIKVDEILQDKGLSLKGNIYDIITYLEREQERCGKISVTKYLRLRRLEKEISNQVGTHDIRRYQNAK